MNKQAACELGTRLIPVLEAGKVKQAYRKLSPVLAQKIPFPILGMIGETIGPCSFKTLDPFLDYIAEKGTMGGWVVIGTALGQHLERGLVGTFSRCRKYVILADCWYGTDILGERIPGPALVSGDFKKTLSLLQPWCKDKNRWVRRVIGVAVHFWAKRSRGNPELEGQARQLVKLLQPMFEEPDTDAIKGVGWGLKTLGKHYPDLLSEWLTDQIIKKRRNPRLLMIRKATTYLGDYNL
ncbi:MAG: DNA alkylation repair protein [Anaerolineales bacterium]|nr:DNA alkylation repair protein [Anaerolineales bacterium]